MAYWLMKSEPHKYSIDDLKKDKRTHWDGIRNYQARNFIRDDMKKGDLAFFYHSSCDEVGIAGIGDHVHIEHQAHHGVFARGEEAAGMVEAAVEALLLTGVAKEDQRPLGRQGGQHPGHLEDAGTAAGIVFGTRCRQPRVLGRGVVMATDEVPIVGTRRAGEGGDDVLDRRCADLERLRLDGETWQGGELADEPVAGVVDL